MYTGVLNTGLHISKTLYPESQNFTHQQAKHIIRKHLKVVHYEDFGEERYHVALRLYTHKPEI